MDLTTPAARGARLVARARLAELDAARARLERGDDADALHAVRVALRRLRATVRAYAPQLDDAIGDKGRRWMKRLARATGEARDLEVHVAWLADRQARASRADRAGIQWLRASLEARQPEAELHVRRAVERDAHRLHRRLDRRLATYTAPVRDDADARWGAVVAHHVQAALATLRDRLGHVTALPDQAAAHETRIAGKQLRYLLEPVEHAIEAARAAVAELRTLQDVLGDMHDAHVFGGEVAVVAAACEAAESASIRARVAAGSVGTVGTLDDAPAPAPAPRVRRARSRLAGLRALQRDLAAREQRGFIELRDRWLADSAASLVATVERAIAQLHAAAAPDPVEVERKYLLRGLPRTARRAPSALLEQGYLPGDELRERVRREHGADGDRFTRTVKLGAGVTRTEVEEETTHDVFRTLWRLTKGRRVRKRRYRVPHEGFVWEVDRFLDRDLVLAEIELPTPDTPVVFPDWLADHVVREVTDEGEYTNARLAR